MGSTRTLKTVQKEFFFIKAYSQNLKLNIFLEVLSCGGFPDFGINQAPERVVCPFALATNVASKSNNYGNDEETKNDAVMTRRYTSRTKIVKFVCESR